MQYQSRPVLSNIWKICALRVGIPLPGETCRLPDFLIKVWQSDFATEETIIFTEAKSLSHRI
jgi:hypothetical protein